MMGGGKDRAASSACGCGQDSPYSSFPKADIMSEKTCRKKERVAKVLGRRLSSMLLRTSDTKKPASSPRLETEPQSQRSSLTVINSQQQQKPASECSSSSCGKRLSRRASLRQRFWSASSSNVDSLDGQGGPGTGTGTGPYVPQHAASGFTKTAASGPGCEPVIEEARKVVGRRPSTARVMADEANARIMQRFSTCGAPSSPLPREDDEHTLCSSRNGSVSGRAPSGEIDGVISSLYREQALSALSEARRRPSDPSPMSSPRALPAVPDDDSSDDDEYGVFQDHGESRRHARRSVLPTAEADRSVNRQSMASLNLLSAPSRSSVASSRSFISQPHRNSTLSHRTSGGLTSRTSVYSNRSSVLSQQSSVSSSSDVSDRGSFCDPVLHRGSTYLDPAEMPTPDSLASLDKLRSLTVPNTADLAKGSQKRKHSTAQAPRFETVMEV
ncbi:hypothetical protein B0J13DRAFT_35890 [Dactylonectria estremocensis]|uniref:Uncharacterized protein n=1 Tax=Dactylonectria estremocensis TaxID=1079267 RepID=A0A9P9FK89_9HYPO|nr:hypothetical protein B0J13DRAFT_35890 [Dactylonectria estremocensis]